jgi:hypothetical protein
MGQWWNDDDEMKTEETWRKSYSSVPQSLQISQEVTRD